MSRTDVATIEPLVQHVLNVGKVRPFLRTPDDGYDKAR